MTVVWSNHKNTWPDRLARAQELAERNPWSREVLTFYAKVLQFQAEAPLPKLARPNVTLRESLDLDLAAGLAPRLAALVRTIGPANLAAEAADWQQMTRTEVRALLEAWLHAPPGHDSALAFFPRALLEPQAERLAASLTPQSSTTAGNQCPVCQSLPQLAVLRPEGDGGKRLLLCSLCHTEWDFRRVLCPFCGETNHEKLPRYTVDDSPAIRVEACDTCHTYLKSVDLTLDGHAIPLVDEVATAPLDLWAQERGYRKIWPNLMGF